jgi:hypothetical protein
VRNTSNIVVKILKAENHLRDLDLDGRIVVRLVIETGDKWRARGSLTVRILQLAEQLAASLLRSPLHHPLKQVPWHWSWRAPESLASSKVAPSGRKWKPLKHFTFGSRSGSAERERLCRQMEVSLISTHGAVRQSTCDCASLSSLSVSCREVVNLRAASCTVSGCVGTVLCVMLSQPLHTERQGSLVVLPPCSACIKPDCRWAGKVLNFEASTVPPLQYLSEPFKS